MFQLDNGTISAVYELKTLFYASKDGTTNMNSFGNEIFSSKNRGNASYMLTPYHNTLQKHAIRACCQVDYGNIALKVHGQMFCTCSIKFVLLDCTYLQNSLMCNDMCTFKTCINQKSVEESTKDASNTVDEDEKENKVE